MFKTLKYCMVRSFLGNCEPAKSRSVPPALAGADARYDYIFNIFSNCMLIFSDCAIVSVRSSTFFGVPVSSFRHLLLL